MFIKLIYGDSRMLILNPNCTAKIFTDYVKEKCSFDTSAIIDLCDEEGSLANIHTKQPRENIMSQIVARSTYIPVLVEKGQDDSIKNLLPLLVEWETRYPTLENRLKQQTAAAPPPPAEKPTGKKTGHETGKSRREKRERDKSNTDSRRPSLTVPVEVSQKHSSAVRIGRKK